jgi:predicted ATPase
VSVNEETKQAALQRDTPRELPLAVRGFTGRSAELEALTRLLDRSGEQAPGAVLISAIGGTAGVGKTALAVRWAHQVAGRFPDGQLYVNLRGYDPGLPVPATDALAGFLGSLSVPGQDIPLDQDERAALYRSLLVGKRMLIVLDNAGSADQVRPLLPGTKTCTVLVTSRDALIGLIAGDGAARRPAISLAVLASELADLPTRLDLLAAGGDPRTQVRTVFSWSLSHLDDADARTFRLLGLHPGPDFEPYAVAALTGTTVPQACQALDALARAHLIQPAAPGRYGMHDLLRGYARELSATADPAFPSPLPPPRR